MTVSAIKKADRKFTVTTMAHLNIILTYSHIDWFISMTFYFSIAIQPASSQVKISGKKKKKNGQKTTLFANFNHHTKERSRK